MKIIEQFSKFLGNLSNEKTDERFSTLRIAGAIEKINEISEISVKVFDQNIPKRDDYKISIIIEQEDALVLTRQTNVNEYIIHFQEYFQYYEEGEIITATLEIDKGKIDNTISIYNFESLNEFIESNTSIGILGILTTQKNNSKSLNYEYLEDGKHPFHTSCFRFGYSFSEEQQTDSLELLRANCYFTDASKFPYTPTDFHVIRRPQADNTLIQHFDTLKALFTITAIYDYSTLKETVLEYKLKGYRLYQGEIQIDKDFYSKTSEYFSLYKWIYSSNGNVTDKLGVARNIISLHINEKSIEIDDSLIHSIKSAHQTYLKENVSNYLNLRSKILDELSWISQKASEVIDKYLQAYKQSSLTFVSFFISIFLLRTLKNGEFNKVFTSEVTIIALAFLCLSVCYLIFSRYNITKERDRIVRKYTNIKNRYKDLLISEDIEKILDGDSEFEYEKCFINKRIKNYTWLWGITIFILIITILAVSEIIPFSLYYSSID